MKLFNIDKRDHIHRPIMSEWLSGQYVVSFKWQQRPIVNTSAFYKGRRNWQYLYVTTSTTLKTKHVTDFAGSCPIILLTEADHPCAVIAARLLTVYIYLAAINITHVQFWHIIHIHVYIIYTIYICVCIYISLSMYVLCVCVYYCVVLYECVYALCVYV